MNSENDITLFNKAMEALFGFPPINAAVNKFASALGVAEPTQYASIRPSQLGVTWSAQRDYQDALRHILIAGELQRTHPLLARSLLWGHEFTGDLLGQSPQSRKMDEENNRLGLLIGSQSPNRKVLELKALNALPWASVLQRQETIPSYSMPSRNK